MRRDLVNLDLGAVNDGTTSGKAAALCSASTSDGRSPGAPASGDGGGSEEERDRVGEPLCDDRLGELVFECTRFRGVEYTALSSRRSPTAEAENVVDGGRVPDE
ncbi:hypothetical protein ABZ777_04100 [Micromonospora parva]|uniref:hypothetical protein n=1 Tax=Micromonospora parva TaxID=1464048 RepID=UPI0033C72B6A